MVRRMLVIDDEEPILFALREYFTLLGYQVKCARDPAEAETFLAGSPPAVVILDLRLSGVESTEGLELVDTIRGRCPEARILLLTAYGNPAIEQEAVRRGADAFLNKPAPLPEIAQIVAGLLGARPGARCGRRACTGSRRPMADALSPVEGTR